MTSEQNVFRNLFSAQSITSNRLYNFALDAVGKLQTNAAHTALASTIATTAAALGKEIGEVSSSLAVQKSSTQNNNQVVKSFAKFMSENEGVIRQALGGYNSIGYTQMYPQGITPYTNATKLQMVSLLKQVFDAATTHSSLLTPTMVSQLKGFTQQWNDSREAQNAKKGTVADNRTERTTNRLALENALLVAVHTIAATYPGDVATCSSFFSFSMLEAPSRRNRNAVNTPITPAK